MTTTTTVEAFGFTFTATVTGSVVTIARDGELAGTGILDGGRIDDCDAELVTGRPDASECVYSLLEEGLGR